MKTLLLVIVMLSGMLYSQRLSTPVLVSPSDGASDLTNPIVFKWNKVDQATVYRIQISKSSSFDDENGFADPVLNETTSSLSFSWNNGEYGTKYYWSVRAGSTTIQNSKYASKRYFRVHDRLNKPQLNSPCGDVDLTNPVHFDWGNVSGAESYRIQISTTNNIDPENGFTNPLVNQVVSSSNYDWNGGEPGVKYYWAVRAGSNSIYQSQYSSICNFTMKSRLSAPQLIQPCNQNGVGLPIRFTWGSVSSAEVYRIHISESSSFDLENGLSNPLVNETTNNAEFSWSGGIAGKKYYWCVRAGSGTVYQSKYSQPCNFTILDKLATPALIAPQNGVSGLGNSINFSWASVPNATAYRIQIASTIEFSGSNGLVNPIVNEQVTETTFNWQGAENGITYYWTVRSGSESIPHSDFATPWSFSRTQRLQTPVLLNPANGVINLENPVSFDWSDVINATTYRLHIGVENTFSPETGLSGIVYNDIQNSSSFVWEDALAGRQYYWSVRAGSETIYHSLFSTPGAFSVKKAYGIVTGTYNGVRSYSNGSTGTVSNEYNFVNGTNTGMKWQCVELVNRYYLVNYGKNVRVAGHNANDYYPNASQHGLISFANNGSVAPAPGDILCSNSQEYGHVAIIREVGNGFIKVIQQNWFSDWRDEEFSLNYSNSGGIHSVDGFNSSYPIAGWLRVEGSGTDEFRHAWLNYNVLQNYPNPFNPLTTIVFTIPSRQKIKLSVFNQTGQLIAELLNAEYEAGTHSVKFNGNNLPSGVYLCKLNTADRTLVRKLLLLK